MAAQITMTQDQLQAFVNQAFQNTITAFQATQPAVAPAPAPAAATLIAVHVQQFEKPEKYKGVRGRDLERFISQCEAYFVVGNVATNVQRVMTALGRLSEEAAQWAIGITDHMAANTGALPLDVDT